MAVTTDYRTVLGKLLSRRCGNGDLAAVSPGYARPPFSGVFRAG